MSEPSERRYEVVVRRRFHYPGFVTRVRIVDRRTGTWLDFNDQALAEQRAAALGASEGTRRSTSRLKHYLVVSSPTGRKTYLRRVDTSVSGYLVGVSSDAALARRAADVLDELDPARLAPPRPIKIGW